MDPATVAIVLKAAKAGRQVAYVVTSAEYVTRAAKKFRRCYRCGQPVGSKGALITGLCGPCCRDRAQGETEGFYRYPIGKARRRCRSCGTTRLRDLRLISNRFGTEICKSCHSAGYTGLRGRDGYPDDEVYTSTESPIERALLKGLLDAKLPAPASQVNVHDEAGVLLTRVDFAYPDQQIAIYCDGYTYHNSEDAQNRDNRQRNGLQNAGWQVYAFTGEQIRDDLESCVETIRKAIA